MSLPASLLTRAVVMGERWGSDDPVNNFEGSSAPPNVPHPSIKLTLWPKTHTFPNHFGMPKCAKSHSNLEFRHFFWRRTPSPLSAEGKGNVERGIVGGGRRKGDDRGWMEKKGEGEGSEVKGRVRVEGTPPNKKSLLQHCCLNLKCILIFLQVLQVDFLWSNNAIRSKVLFFLHCSYYSGDSAFWYVTHLKIFDICFVKHNLNV